MTVAPHRIRRTLAATIPSVALLSWYRWRLPEGRVSPIDTFKWLVAALALHILTYAVLTAVGARPSGVRRALAAAVHRHRRAAAALFGLALSFVIVAAVELAFLSFNQSHAGTRKLAAAFTRPDPLLGYSLLPGAETDAACSFGEESIYRARYTIDASGRRRTVVTTRPGARAVAFFGCSATFGEGLDDDETIPSAYGRLAANHLPVNFGVPGHGPNHVLARLESDGRPAIPKGPLPPIGVLLFIDAHVERCVGSMNVVNSFGHEAPYYDYVDGRLTRVGDFLHDRPVRSVVYWLLGKSQTLAHLGFDWPPAGRDADVALASDVIVRCAEEFRRRTGSAEFAMVVYPGSTLGRRVGDRVRESGLRVLDYTDLFDPRARGYSFPHDGHPTAAAAELVAARLAADLAEH
jgi:hypothetical protein